MNTSLKNTLHILLKIFSVPCYAYPRNFSSINSQHHEYSKRFHGLKYQLEDQFFQNCASKDKIEMESFLLFEQRAKEKTMKLRAAANFFQ